MSGAEILIIGAVLAAAGTGASMYGAQQAGEAQGRAAKLSADLEARDRLVAANLADREHRERMIQIEMERDLLSADHEQFDRAANRLYSQQRAAIASSGFEPDESFLQVIGESGREIGLEKERLTLQSEQRVRALRYEADTIGFQADELRRQADFAGELGLYQYRQFRKAGNLQAGALLLSGAGRTLLTFA